MFYGHRDLKMLLKRGKLHVVNIMMMNDDTMLVVSEAVINSGFKLLLI